MIQEQPKNKKEEYAKMVCYFLAEQLRIHKISLKRAAEIGQKVLDNLNLIDSERDFLKLVKELARDFEELVKLEDRTFLFAQESERHKMEKAVRDYVIATLSRDMPSALMILSAAIAESASMDSLCGQFPQFKQFIKS